MGRIGGGEGIRQDRISLDYYPETSGREFWVRSQGWMAGETVQKKKQIKNFQVQRVQTTEQNRRTVDKNIYLRAGRKKKRIYFIIF